MEGKTEQYYWDALLRLVATGRFEYKTIDGQLMARWLMPSYRFGHKDITTLTGYVQRLFVGQHGVQSASITRSPDGGLLLQMPALSYEHSMDDIDQAYKKSLPKVFRDEQGVSWLQFAPSKYLDGRMMSTLILNANKCEQDTSNEQPSRTFFIGDSEFTTQELFSSAKRVLLMARIRDARVYKSGTEIKITIPEDTFDRAIEKLSQAQETDLAFARHGR